MGANLVTAYWDPSDVDKSLKRSLEKIAIRHGASVNIDGFDQCADYKPGKTSFSADISSFSILWYGGQEAAMKTLHNIQREWDIKPGFQMLTEYLSTLSLFRCKYFLIYLKY